MPAEDIEVIDEDDISEGTSSKTSEIDTEDGSDDDGNGQGKLF